jgi:anthranilate phosphoribosyltransferase
MRAQRDCRDQLDRLCRRDDLSREETRALFGAIIAGEVSELELAALLAALRCKGETADEIAGAAEALRDAAATFPAPNASIGARLADSCGTGGDGAQTVNISTAVALLAAECGLPMVKHGNRSVSSSCGSADVLERCGVRVDASAEVSARALEQLSICFLFAPQYHSGVRHAMPVRRALGVRTIFNMIGPLANPARPQVQLMGVYAPELLQPMARTLTLLGCSSALVVHGGGLDEIALHAPTQAARVRNGLVTTFEIEPEELGLSRQPLSALRGGDADANARWLRGLLAGQGPEAHAQAVALNTGALLWISDQAKDLATGYQRAREALDAGGAAERLAAWAKLTSATLAGSPEQPEQPEQPS